jgi:hypothetical protein
MWIGVSLALYVAGTTDLSWRGFISTATKASN